MNVAEQEIGEEAGQAGMTNTGLLKELLCREGDPWSYLPDADGVEKIAASPVGLWAAITERLLANLDGQLTARGVRVSLGPTTNDKA